MIEIKNKSRSPIQIMVRSRESVAGSGSRAFTTLNIPGVGAGNNVYLLDDERHTPQIDRLENKGLIETRRISNTIRKED